MLGSFQGTEFSVNELIVAASRVIPGFAGEQTRYRVTEQVDPRTLRYYIHRGLVDKPLRYSGRNGVYGYRHLLQLVAIKRLQSEYLPLRKVQEMMEGLDDNDLEDLIGELRDTGPPPRADAPMQSLSLMDSEIAGKAPTPQARRKSGPGLGEGLLGAIFERSRRQVAPPEPPTEPSPTRWTRHEIAPGLEVHVRDDYPVDVSKSTLKVWAVRFQKLLQSRSKGGSK